MAAASEAAVSAAMRRSVFGLGAGSHSNLFFVFCSIVCSPARSRGPKSVTQTPLRPARPVRPDR